MENCYPKWLYHAKAEPLMVQSKSQHEALGPGWAESPDEAKALAAAASGVGEKPKKDSPKPKDGR